VSAKFIMAVEEHDPMVKVQLFAHAMGAIRAS
jgi:hypothetical protein